MRKNESEVFLAIEAANTAKVAANELGLPQSQVEAAQTIAIGTVAAAGASRQFPSR